MVRNIVSIALQSDCCLSSAMITNSSAGASIQFICTANRAHENASARNSPNLFTEYLLENIAEENVTITDIFQRVKDLVDRKSKQTQQTRILNQLQEHQEVYLNVVDICTYRAFFFMLIPKTSDA